LPGKSFAEGTDRNWSSRSRDLRHAAAQGSRQVGTIRRVLVEDGGEVAGAMQNPDHFDAVRDWSIEALHPPHAQTFNASMVSRSTDLRQIEQHGERTIDRRKEAPRGGGIVPMIMECLVK
jgi:hypothetical protein